MATHLIIGTGEGVDIPRSVINESLKDVLKEGDSLVVGWYGERFDAIEHVYDYIFDHEIQTTLVWEAPNKPPKVFMEADFISYAEGAMTEMFLERWNHSAPLMVLGVGQETEVLLCDVFSGIGHNSEVIDLGDGLSPVDMWGDEVPPGDKPETLVEVKDEDPTDDGEVSEEDDPDPFSFSREELMNMPQRVLKRLAAKVVPEDEMPTTSAKEPYVDAIEAAEAVVMADDAPYGEVTIVNGLARDAMGVEDFILAAKDVLHDMHDEHPTRSFAITITKLEEALLWYHYGDKFHGQGGS